MMIKFDKVKINKCDQLNLDIKIALYSFYENKYGGKEKLQDEIHIVT